MSDIKNAILAHLKSATETLSATRITREVLGQTKKVSPAVKSALDELVEEGIVEASFDGAYTTYEVSTAAKTTRSVQSETAASGLETRTFPGYEVSSYGNRTKISCPDGSEHVLNKSETLMVINGVPSFVIQTPRDAIGCIADWTKTQGMATVTVTDMSTNSRIDVVDDVSLGEGRILSLEIQAHNKAAA